MHPEHLALIEEFRRAAPANFKIEFSGDIVIMQASPSAIHERNLSVVRRQFEAHAPAGYLSTGNMDLASPQVSKLRNPDLTYLPEDAMTSTENKVPAELALIAVEIVSPSNPENDWVGKLRDYPLMQIPLYLLVDAAQKTVTLFSEPEAGRYRIREDADFGEAVHLPEPFGFTLDTTVLLPY
ncbi:Uma2 family endonuclease [Kitasatospora sp. NPDC101183]|uniref:Uma2 family endonuclease n=1 Tax=Kitasatospora sp. NPDC101183 TaxID=3364100 RepID=UPI0037FF010D